MLLNMWSQLIEKYKDPHLVARIQEFFGIEIHYDMDIQDEYNEYPNQKTNDTSHKVSDIIPNGYIEQGLQDNLKKRKIGVFCLSEEDASSTHSSDEEKCYTIKNRIWYYLFLFSTQLGDEIFYSTFIPFWFWNIDGAVGRRVVLVWATIMTCGQAMKDVMCWPRPSCPPAVRLQKKWSLEYGMPSTHAMIAVSIPFSVLIFTMNRYIYSTIIGCVIATIWCTMICLSRLYLGMHTVLDVAVGLILAVTMMILLVPLIDILDYYLVTNGFAAFALVVLSVIIITFYPRSNKWTPTRGDTTLVVAFTAGVYVAAWLNYTTGAFSIPPLPPPYSVMWPSYKMCGKMILRTILGLCCIIGSKAACKILSYATICTILRINSKELMKSKNCFENRNKILVDLIYKYLACFIIGINTVYLLPNVFTMLNIERPTFYTEL